MRTARDVLLCLVVLAATGALLLHMIIHRADGIAIVLVLAIGWVIWMVLLRRIGRR